MFKTIIYKRQVGTIIIYAIRIYIDNAESVVVAQKTTDVYKNLCRYVGMYSYKSLK